MKKFNLTRIVVMSLIMVCSAITLNAQTPNDTPRMEYVMTLKVKLGQAFSVGSTPHGERNVVPITGGTFEGPSIKGTIIPGGADWQMTNKETGRTEVEAIYAIKTDDGVNIHIRNNGIICTGKDSNGNPQFYFKCAPRFEAPIGSKYAWLNNSLFLCSPTFGGENGTISLKVWKVL